MVHAHNPKTRNLPILEKAGCVFKDIHNKSATLVDTNTNILLEPVKNFQGFVINVRKATEILNNQGYKELVRKIGVHKYRNFM